MKRKIFQGPTGKKKHYLPRSSYLLNRRNGERRTIKWWWLQCVEITTIPEFPIRWKLFKKKDGIKMFSDKENRAYLSPMGFVTNIASLEDRLKEIDHGKGKRSWEEETWKFTTERVSINRSECQGKKKITMISCEV